MPDFATLIKRPAGVAKRPPPMPAFDYPAIITSYEPGKNEKTGNEYIRWHVKVTGWPESLPESARQDHEGNEIDFSKRSFRMDMYTTDDALIMLDDFIRSCGVNLPEDGSVTYEEAIPQCIGAQVVASVQQTFNDKSSETYNPPWLKSLRGNAGQ